jgi:hypothetical protein
MGKATLITILLAAPLWMLGLIVIGAALGACVGLYGLGRIAADIWEL